MRLSTFIAAAALVVITTTAASAQSVSFDYDKSANFSSFKTYTWVRGTEVPDEFNHARVVAAVNEQLAAKKLTSVEHGANADLFVAYHAVFDQDVQVSGFADGWGPYRLGRNVSARAEKILKGTLVVDIVDSRTNTIVWRGIASDEVDTKADPRKRERNINRAAARLFKNYPPAAK
jgi:hypothetical protein